MLKIMAIGNLTSDIELKNNAEGQPYSLLRIASADIRIERAIS